MQAEQRATRETVALYDQTSFGKLLLQGRDALAVLQRLCAADVSAADAGRVVYTPMLNPRGGYESDCTVMRLAPERYLIVTGSAQPVRDADWIQRHIEAHEHAVLHDASNQWSVLSLMGPRSRELLQSLTADDVSAAALPFAHAAEIDLAHARVRAARMAYVGGLGFELYVPVEMARHVYLALQAAGSGLGLADAGYYALDALRIEAGRRAWGAELGPDESPVDAGLMATVALDKPQPFIGQEALRRLAAEPPRKKLLVFVADEPAAYLWGGEPIVHEGRPLGELSSAGWSPKVGACVAMGYVRGDAALREHHGTPMHVELWGVPVAVKAYDRLP
jgi:4-methylaminobutanoate oxidase (formaldehyde-forming)